MPNLLEIHDLVTEFDTDEGVVRAVDQVSFEVKPGATLGLVGESGCGKSVTALSVMQLLPNPAGRIVSGNIFFQGLDLTHLSIAEMENLRGNEIGMVFQEPMTALNPVQTIGRQLTEVLHLHTDQSDASALQAAVEILEKVGIPSPEIRLSEYPHQLSGGMRQRVLIAIALICSPSLLIADEPTTALDVTIQAQILDLIENLQKQLGMAVLMITHDLGVIAETCQDVVVMYAGKVVEKGSVFDIFDHPKHPYTQGLLRSIPRLDSPAKSKLEVIDGMVPGLLDLPSGCRFQNRCPLKTAQCEYTSPAMELVNSNHQVSCLNWKNP
ncbi:MAG TPA: ABC transporter ATP-binding protein [Gammaproteobacteria bacterium]|nr:ABC transporter ATP-binding protein [Gammaproteobacteria bacterium]HIK69579.1 ABC transporter ATP-binding protein [Pseudomonadales bacterium]